ncbi:MAG TPA: hypothetical protein VKZ81_21755 [Pseudonocardia sp.]|uniref:hypothetical protein n=1 Tax=Pseudonocardia sp. TaxID=60912 RepID=UPI002B4B7A40|nr:hypothetical protein [Pseudonocardia sp.]HLU58095.1 hypothetical protein [Pseudonocardia sp.]
MTAPEPRGRRGGSTLTRLLRGEHPGWADDRELAHAIHGTVVGAAAMAAASVHGTLGEVVVTVLVTVFVYWVAERYARVLGVAVGGRPRLHVVTTVLRHGWPMVESAYTPLVVLVAVDLVTGNLRAGVLAALVVATVLLGGLGHLAARRAGASPLVALAWASLSAALGVVIIVLKLSLH